MLPFLSCAVDFFAGQLDTSFSFLLFCTSGGNLLGAESGELTSASPSADVCLLSATLSSGLLVLHTFRMHSLSGQIYELSDSVSTH